MVRDETNEELKRIVLKYGSLPDSASIETKRRAIDALGARGAAKELGEIVRSYGSLPDSASIETKRRALQRMQEIE
jgi:hypothetical protein